jgi:long-subunit fatty acid transport protein
VLAIEFSFSNPGARSMGFGGAFAGLADDATAAFANPAGLAQLAAPEVSVEGRAWGYSTSFVEGGRISGEPTGIGVDTTAGLRTATSSQEIAGVSFLSFVYPKSRWSLAFYRHQLADFEFFGETQGIITALPEIHPGAVRRDSDLRAATDFEILTHGVSLACRLTDRFSLGLGLAHFEGSMRAASEAYSPTGLFTPNPYAAELLEQYSIFSIDSTDWGFNTGMLWRFSDQWRLGAFLRQGPRFELSTEFYAGPDIRLPVPPGTLLAELSSPIDMPDIYGLGFAFQSPDGAFTAGFEWDRVEYASIVDSLDFEGMPVVVAVDDADEVHLGAEYAFSRTTPLLAFRTGIWLDPDHRLRATEDTEAFERAVRQPGEDELHFAAGFGVAFNRIQLDVGFDLSDTVDTASVSMIYSF